MTKIKSLNFEFADTDCQVSVCHDGSDGFDMHEVSTGNWLGTVDDLREAEWFFQTILDEQTGG